MEVAADPRWKGADELRQHLVPIEGLEPFPGNARRGDIPALMKSLERWGQVRAVLVWGTTIVAGHHVTEAARRLEWSHVAAIPAEFPDRDDARDYLIADNQLQALGHIETSDQITLLDEVAERGTWEGTGFTREDWEDMRALSQAKSERMKIADLKQHKDNYRDHPPDQVEHLVRSMREHGIYREVVVANDGTILAGHGLYLAAQEIGLNSLPVMKLDVGPDDPEALKIIAGDNEISRLAELDDRTLTEALKRVVDEGDATALLGTGYNAQTLANLIFVTRPASEITDHDAAAQWVGLPGFEAIEKAPRAMIQFDTYEDRERFFEKNELVLTQMRPTAGSGSERVWSAWWPPRKRQDLISIRFQEGQEDDQDQGGDRDVDDEDHGSAQG